jgi:hypothetical protein
LSEDRPPKLRKPGTGDPERKSTRRFKKPETNIREKLDSLELKKKGTDITSKVSSLKSKTNSLKSKTNKDEEKRDGPKKLGKSDTQPKESRSDILKRNSSQILRKNPILLIISIIILIILVVTAAMWSVDDVTSQNQTNNTKNQTNTQKNHFSDGNVSFDYPEGWNITSRANSTNSESHLLVTISKDENNSVSIFREDLGTQNFTYRVSAWRSNIMKNGMIYYEGGLTMDNQTAYELMANFKPGDKVYATRGIALQKNNILYFIIFIFDDPLLDYSGEMDKIINSFNVTENPI